MLAYAPRRESLTFRPSTLVAIAAAHALALAAVMSARIAIEPKERDTTEVTLIEQAKPPEAARPVERARLPQVPLPLPVPEPLVPIRPDPMPPIDVAPGPIEPGPVVEPLPMPLPVPSPEVVRTGPRFATSDALVRPPYPEARRASGDEAALRLRLSIDSRGRVVAVDPIGAVDPLFLEAARRHILRHWRYRPAFEGDEAVPSSTVITLRFELD